MNDAGVIFGSYAVTVGGIAADVVWMLRRALARRGGAARGPPVELAVSTTALDDRPQPATPRRRIAPFVVLAIGAVALVPSS